MNHEIVVQPQTGSLTQLPPGVRVEYSVQDTRFEHCTKYFSTAEAAAHYLSVHNRCGQILDGLPNWQGLELLDLPGRPGIGYVKHPIQVAQQFWSDFIALVVRELGRVDLSDWSLSADNVLQTLKQISNDTFEGLLSRNLQVDDQDQNAAHSLMILMRELHPGLAKVLERAQLVKSGGQELLEGRIERMREVQGLVSLAVGDAPG